MKIKICEREEKIMRTMKERKRRKKKKNGK